MPDIDTSFYAKPTNPLDNLSKVYGVLGANQNLQLGQQALQIRQSQFQQGQSDDLRTTIGNLYNTGASPEQTMAAVLSRARQGQYSPQVTNDVISEINRNKGNWDDYGKNMRAQATGNAGLTNFTTTYPTTGGTPQLQPATSVPRPSARTQPPSSSASNPPGYEAAVGGNVKAALELEGSAGTTNQQRADIQNLVSESNIVGNHFAPTFELEKKANQVLQRFGLPGTMTKEELAAGEGFDKITHMLTSTQTAMYGPSDARQANQMASLPSSSISGLGVKGITKMMLGNTDAIDAKRNAWFIEKAKTPPGQPIDHNAFSNDWNNQYDPRAFH